MQPAKARVSKLKGKIVESVSVDSTTTSNLEIAPYDSRSCVAFSTSHGLINLDLVSLTGLIPPSIVFKELSILVFLLRSFL